MRSGPELDAPFHFAVAGHAAQGHVVQLLAIQVVERSGMRKREWIPLASAAPFPKLVMILPLMSPPAPAVVQAFGAGSSAVPYLQSGPGSVVSPTLFTSLSPLWGFEVLTTPSPQSR